MKFKTLLQYSNAMFNSENMVNMPYYAYITFSSIQMSFYGGGALISSSHVLTSGANTNGLENNRNFELVKIQKFVLTR